MLANFLMQVSDNTMKRIEHVLFLITVGVSVLIVPMAIALGFIVSVFAAGSVFVIGSLFLVGMFFFIDGIIDVSEQRKDNVLYVVMKSS